MLKDAALLTLEIQKKCIEQGFSLKDASAYNIQFHNGKPILIDITSFEMYQEEPWIAYRQFCEHFLGPLALMAKKDVRLSKLLVNYIDGIPLDIVSGLVPKTTFTNFGLSAHLHAHAKAQKRYEEKKIEKKKLKKFQLLGIIESLRSTIKNLNLEQKTEWAEYYKDTNYNDEEQIEKEKKVKEFIQKTSSDIIIDLGANDGKFSRIASEKAFEKTKPGFTCADISNAMSSVLNTSSLSSNSVGRMGHGLGLQLTEPPSIMSSDNTKLKENMILTIEPSYEYLPGKILVIEENILITKDSFELLTSRTPKVLPIIN